MNTTPSTSRNRTARFWAVRGGAVAAGVVLVGGAVFGATAAFADGQSPAPSASPSASPSAGSGSGSGNAKHAAHPFVRSLRNELRVDIKGGDGFGDKAHVIAYALIHRAQAFGKLPANLQADLKTLEAAAASDRDAAAAKIKDTALNGGYGDKIQKEAKAIQDKVNQAPAKQ
ncbi:hypothetical protein [Arthrobacter sp. 135MFCol5.1]|uniref:hypothetical protein n=1 Tax=Arthrobacter sp. 135MFCol5.1 TaxID=1158050 RepID=UPI00036C6F69|nr:hypothetical protein [Arthrobacter sp. 135MFCol5.1]